MSSARPSAAGSTPVKARATPSTAAAVGSASKGPASSGANSSAAMSAARSEVRTGATATTTTSSSASKEKDGPKVGFGRGIVPNKPAAATGISSPPSAAGSAAAAATLARQGNPNAAAGSAAAAGSRGRVGISSPAAQAALKATPYQKPAGYTVPSAVSASSASTSSSSSSARPSSAARPTSAALGGRTHSPRRRLSVSSDLDSPHGGSNSANHTPGGISLDLSSSSSNPVPQLLASQTRSERLRTACREEDLLEVTKLLSTAATGSAGAADPNQADGYGSTALMVAASTGNAEIVEELLHAGAALHAKDKYGQTALHYAVAAGSYACTQLLLARKAGVNVATGHGGGGQTALMKAAYITHPHAALIADLLCQHRAKVDHVSPDTGGASAASIAVEHDHLEVLKVLVHYGADVNIQNQAGETLLHLAAKKMGYAMIAQLVSMGADPSRRNVAGQTILQVQPQANASSEAPSPQIFASRVQAAVDRGMALREEAARERAELERIRADIKARRALEAKQARVATDSAAAAAAAAAEEGASTSRRSSGTLTAEQLKERTYRPKLDPKSVFGDVSDSTADSAVPTPASNAVSNPSAASVYAPGADDAARKHGANPAEAGDSAARERTQDELDDEEDRLRRGGVVDDEGEDGEEPPLSYHDLLQLRGQGAAAMAARRDSASQSSFSSGGGGVQGSSASSSVPAPSHGQEDGTDPAADMVMADGSY